MQANRAILNKLFAPPTYLRNVLHNNFVSSKGEEKREECLALVLLLLLQKFLDTAYLTKLSAKLPEQKQGKTLASSR